METKDKRYKLVNMPIKVPDGIYCWGNENRSICKYFDSEGGHPHCSLFYINQLYCKDGVIKPDKCKKLNRVMKKDVYIDGGSRSCGKAETAEQAVELAWKRIPKDVQKQIGSKDKLSAKEFETTYVV